jgi:hypothetical protein
MRTNALFRGFSMILVAVAVSLVILALIYALQNPHLLVTIASIGWNG